MRRHRAEALRNLPKPTGAARCVSTWREADGEVRECRQAVYGSGRVAGACPWWALLLLRGSARDCRELQKGRSEGGDTIEIWGQS